MSKKALRDFLIGDASVHDAIDDAIYWGHVPQGGKYPCIVLSTISRNHEYELTNEAGKIQHLIQIDVYAKGRRAALEVEEIAELIRLRLSGYRGQLNDDVYCHGAFLQRDGEAEERPQDASDDWPRRQSMDFNLHITSTVPTH